MILHAPFFISARLAPALKIGDATLSLIKTEVTDERRVRCTFALDTPEFEYIDCNMQSGCGGFREGPVEAFDSFLSFLAAGAEAARYGPESDNYDLFPPHIMQWCEDNDTDIGNAQCDIQDEDGNPLYHLIDQEK